MGKDEKMRTLLRGLGMVVALVVGAGWMGMGASCGPVARGPYMGVEHPPGIAGDSARIYIDKVLAEYDSVVYVAIVASDSSGSAGLRVQWVWFDWDDPADPPVDPNDNPPWHWGNDNYAPPGGDASFGDIETTLSQNGIARITWDFKDLSYIHPCLGNNYLIEAEIQYDEPQKAELEVFYWKRIRMEVDKLNLDGHVYDFTSKKVYPKAGEYFRGNDDPNFNTYIEFDSTTKASGKPRWYLIEDDIVTDDELRNHDPMLYPPADPVEDPNAWKVQAEELQELYRDYDGWEVGPKDECIAYAFLFDEVPGRPSVKGATLCGSGVPIDNRILCVYLKVIPGDNDPVEFLEALALTHELGHFLYDLDDVSGSTKCIMNPVFFYAWDLYYDCHFHTDYIIQIRHGNFQIFKNNEKKEVRR
ncbi:MAG: hypothetical protein ABIM74_00770 [candidate division WOR-3 bacterium]